MFVLLSNGIHINPPVQPYKPFKRPIKHCIFTRLNRLYHDFNADTHVDAIGISYNRITRSDVGEIVGVFQNCSNLQQAVS